MIDLMRRLAPQSAELRTLKILAAQPAPVGEPPVLSLSCDNQEPSWLNREQRQQQQDERYTVETHILLPD